MHRPHPGTCSGHFQGDCEAASFEQDSARGQLLCRQPCPQAVRPADHVVMQRNQEGRGGARVSKGLTEAG